jgi:hypothetical protein
MYLWDTTLAGGALPWTDPGFMGSGLDQGSILVTVIVTLPAMDFHNQFFPVDIVCGIYFTDEHRHGVSTPGAHVKFVSLIRPIFLVFH